MRIRPFLIIRRIFPFLAVFCLLSISLRSCSGPAGPASNTNNKQSLPTNNGSIIYSTDPNDVLIRTFYGGGNLGTLEISPEISIYGDGSYILGPDLDMRQGQLNSASLGQLLHILVDSDGLLNLSRRQFYDLPDRDATLLQLMLNDKYYEFLYGQFGYLQESEQDMKEYHRLGNALSSIAQTLNGPTHTYISTSTALLVHEDFGPDLTRTIPSWTLQDFTLAQVALFECGPIPPDVTSPNHDTGCLTFTIPHHVVLLTTQQLQTIKVLLNGHQRGDFVEQQLYYTVIIRPLLPDELPSQMLAMFGSQELSYTGVPLHKGPIPSTP